MTAAGALGISEGDVLAGKYRIERVLGAGGMGVVLAARHLDLDERVAIKLLLPDVLEHPDAVARFLREARAAVKIRSEHVARVMDVGKLDDGAPYIVMEYLEGSDLAAWLKHQGPLSVEQTVEFVLQACEALAEAHALGVVHRDLKPSNLFVTRRRDGTLAVKVLDFGISKVSSAFGAGQSVQTTGVIGSPLYMSPEQMQSSRDVDVRCDIWALGVIVYELIAGSPPFVAASMPELVLRVVQGDPARPLGELRPDLPEAFERVVMKCLERDRTRRFDDLGELANALLPFGPRRTQVSVERIRGVFGGAGFSATLAAMPAPAVVDAPADVRVTDASWGRTARPKGRNRRFVALAVAAGVVLGLEVVRAVWAHAPRGQDMPSSARPVTAAVQPAAAFDPTASRASATGEARAEHGASGGMSEPSSNGPVPARAPSASGASAPASVPSHPSSRPRSARTTAAAASIFDDRK